MLYQPNTSKDETLKGDRSGFARIVIGFLVFLVIVSFFLSLASGPVFIAASDIWNVLFLNLDDPELNRTKIIIFDIRFPRTVLGILVGGGLALAGALMQGLFRNPLAEPGVVGVSSGAALAAVLMIVLGDVLFTHVIEHFKSFAIPVAAFLGSLAALTILYGISTYQGQTLTTTMLLAGIAITALTNALIGILVFLSTDQQLRDLTFWTLGSLGGATWSKVWALSFFIIPCFIASLFIANKLNALLLGEREAHFLGVRVQALKRSVIIIAACSAGSAVAASGIIGFVGIIVPHLVRLMIGPDNRFLIPASILAGGILLLLADIVARLIVTPAELPIGIITSLIGGPFFLWLILKKRAYLNVST